MGHGLWSDRRVGPRRIGSAEPSACAPRDDAAKGDRRSLIAASESAESTGQGERRRDPSRRARRSEAAERHGSQQILQVIVAPTNADAEEGRADARLQKVVVAADDVDVVVEEKLAGES